MRKSRWKVCALLAEDNELNMEITKFMLEDYGIHVECAADGEEAVQSSKI